MCDDSSDFSLIMKSAVLFYRPGPRFHARKTEKDYIIDLGKGLLIAALKIAATGGDL